MLKMTAFGYSIKAELELLRFEEYSVTDNDGDEDVDYGTCSVCLEDFSSTVGSQMVITDCSHFYHASCLLPWLERQNTCPTCRRGVVE
ncbi:e3 ubiquitin-protein ligase ring1 [Quercus suber]|uniref:E3 ubiquitin-protein ligase ring1 n=1 Tax=Quercus suber TaxID=58331 RepID=A0AAW0KDY3_QUESU